MRSRLCERETIGGAAPCLCDGDEELGMACKRIAGRLIVASNSPSISRKGFSGLIGVFPVCCISLAAGCAWVRGSAAIGSA